MLKKLLNRKTIGRLGEDRAERFLKKQGFKILSRNFRCPIGEIDIIAMDGQTLVFIEVKTRRSDRFGTAIEAVDSKKIAKLKKLALYYIKNYYKAEPPVRFDIIGVSGDGEIYYVKGAF